MILTRKLRNYDYRTKWSYGVFTLIVWSFYRPKTKLWEGNVFTPVCHSVHRAEGVYLSACWDTHTPGQTPPGKHPTGQTPPWANTPPGRHPPRRSLPRTVRILLECILVHTAPRPTQSVLYKILSVSVLGSVSVSVTVSVNTP